MFIPKAALKLMERFERAARRLIPQAEVPRDGALDWLLCREWICSMGDCRDGASEPVPSYFLTPKGAAGLYEHREERKEKNLDEPLVFQDSRKRKTPFDPALHMTTAEAGLDRRTIGKWAERDGKEPLGRVGRFNVWERKWLEGRMLGRDTRKRADARRPHRNDLQARA